MRYRDRLVRSAVSTARIVQLRQSNTHIALGSFIDRHAIIGHHTNISAPSYIGECKIGSYCAIAGRLSVRPRNHDISFANMQDAAQRNPIGSRIPVSGIGKSTVEIGDTCWIGDSVIVLPGGSIGTGAVVGAGSIVTKRIPDFAVAAGNPAKVLRMRFSGEVVDFLLMTGWWDWPEEKLAANRDFFETNLAEITSAELAALSIR